MVNEVLIEPESRQWPEWDRLTGRTELSLTLTKDKMVIVAQAQEAEVARLEGNIKGDTLTLSTIFVHPEISLKAKGFFAKAATVPGRARGYGTMLVRAMIAQARRSGLQNVQAEISAQDLAENRYLLEWYSHRGFIVERNPAPATSGAAASIRMIV